MLALLTTSGILDEGMSAALELFSARAHRLLATERGAPMVGTPHSERSTEVGRIDLRLDRLPPGEAHRPLPIMFPIPWLDRNGSHNQPAGLQLEPSHIYDFKGRVARSSTFTGTGTDNRGNRIAFGSPTTDFGAMQGDYWAARAAQFGTFTHI